MSRPKPKRTKKYAGERDCYNPIDLARNAARTISPANRAMLINPALDGFHKLRQGIAVRADWNYVIDVLNAGEALCEMRLAPEFLPDYHAAFKAMHAIAMRMMAGKGSTCYAAEIESIRTGINTYGAQTKLCSQSEYNRAVERVRGRLGSGTYIEETKLRQG